MHRFSSFAKVGEVLAQRSTAGVHNELPSFKGDY